eukprot:CAMPEP_0113641736 /NCGR_PEP_ID=MMETSP0017_2-20120614/21919_1 /TAXON_ID=2856 /ORGANISM="Cylindrotheca closterium" /LENGTH=74 /DNA_ID=CAMNT_0000553111 /DNA_START=193 /DNA_END=417 /DNA_ORIENTATION=- /assembly_acc=CAM_ASM_000147
MSEDKEKVKVEGVDKVAKDKKKKEGGDDEEDLDAIFGDEDDSVRLSKTKLEMSKGQLNAIVAEEDDEELEDDDD